MVHSIYLMINHCRWKDFNSKGKETGLLPTNAGKSAIKYITISHCFFRFRKLKRIEELTNEVVQLKEERKELARKGEVLKQEVTSLRKKLENHIIKGLCEIDFYDQITDIYNSQLG